jgi:anti-sigma regulatory factor (Ser/Thr protein kinase)
MPDTEDEIRLAVPAAPAFARLARLTVAGLATRIGFSYDEVEDLRIGVGEACSLLVGSGSRPGSLELVFRVRPASLDITVTGDDVGDPRRTADAGLSRQILEAVVDSYDLHADSVHLSKRRALEPS